MLKHMTGISSFLKLNNQLHAYTTFYLFIHHDGHLCCFNILWTVMLQTWEYKYLFKTCLRLFVFIPSRRIAGSDFSSFFRPSILFSIAVAPFCIHSHTNKVQVFPFLYIFTRTYHLFLMYVLMGGKWYLIIVLYVFLWWLMMVTTFSYTFSFVCHPYIIYFFVHFLIGFFHFTFLLRL